MKLNAYSTSPIQPGDLVFGYRNGEDVPAMLFSGLGSGSSFDIEITLTLSRDDVLGLNTIGYTLVSPPDGYGVQITAPVVMQVDNDGSTFIFASGQSLEIVNSSLDIGTIATFPDACVTSIPASSAALIYTYEILVNSPVAIRATSAITGGGDNAFMTFTVRYRLLPIG